MTEVDPQVILPGTGFSIGMMIINKRNLTRHCVLHPFGDVSLQSRWMALSQSAGDVKRHADLEDVIVLYSGAIHIKSA